MWKTVCEKQYVNGSEATQLTLVGHIKMTKWQMLNFWITFILHTYIYIYIYDTEQPNFLSLKIIIQKKYLKCDFRRSLRSMFDFKKKLKIHHIFYITVSLAVKRKTVYYDAYILHNGILLFTIAANKITKSLAYPHSMLQNKVDSIIII